MLEVRFKIHFYIVNRIVLIIFYFKLIIFSHKLAKIKQLFLSTF